MPTRLKAVTFLDRVKLSECESILQSRFEFLSTLLLLQVSVRLRRLSGMFCQTSFQTTL